VSLPRNNGGRDRHSPHLARSPPRHLACRAHSRRAEDHRQAGRYGWPAVSELVPVFLTVRTEPGEPGRDDVKVLAVALAALLEHDAAGPTLIEVGPKVTSGTLELAEGEPASFNIRQLPRFEDDAQESLQVYVAGTDLLPLGTPVVMGSTRTAGLRSLRRAARIHRPLPATSPPLPAD
jgi:hypothetical protein